MCCYVRTLCNQSTQFIRKLASLRDTLSHSLHPFDPNRFQASTVLHVVFSSLKINEAGVSKHLCEHRPVIHLEHSKHIYLK